MIRNILGVFAGLLGGLALSAGTAHAQPPVLNAPAISGASVTFSWSPTAGATGYQIQAGVAPGAYSFTLPLGNVTAQQVTAPAVGTYYARVVAVPGGEVSNEVTVVVTTLVAPPAVPTNLQVFRNGSSVVIAWEPGAGGGPVTGFLLRVGSGPSASDIGVLSTAAAVFSANGVPARTYYLGVRAVNAGGQSGESSEVALVMPLGGACDVPPAPTLRNNTFSTYLSVGWNTIPGASGYLLNASQNGVPVPSYQNVPFGPTSTGASAFVSLATYDISVRSAFSCGSQGPASNITIVVDGAPPAGFRIADPAPGQLLSLGNFGYAAGIVDQLARERPELLRASCVEHGGNNRFMFEAVRRLRQRDTRWGLNIKRCSQGPSQDIVAVNLSAVPDEGARTNGATSERNIVIFDIIGGHCGNNPTANWANQTQPTIDQRACAQWTLLPFIQAGFSPVGGQ